MATISKKVKITFWISTILVALMTIPSVFMTNDPSSVEIFNSMGITAEWFRWELEIAKTIAGLVLIVPFIRGTIKEIAYIGLGIDFISAFIGLAAIGNAGYPVAIVATILLAVSYFSYHKIQGTKSPWY